MKRVIWKYELTITDAQFIDMPADAEILSVQMQGDTLCLWALVQPIAELRGRVIYVVGTGNPFPIGRVKHLGTVQQGMFVWHVFEALN